MTFCVEILDSFAEKQTALSPRAAAAAALSSYIYQYLSKQLTRP